jgi:hypothetical protein
VLRPNMSESLLRMSLAAAYCHTNAILSRTLTQSSWTQSGDFSQRSRRDLHSPKHSLSHVSEGALARSGVK